MLQRQWFTSDHDLKSHLSFACWLVGLVTAQRYHDSSIDASHEDFLKTFYLRPSCDEFSRTNKFRELGLRIGVRVSVGLVL